MIKESHLKKQVFGLDSDKKSSVSFSQQGRFNPTNGKKKTNGALVPGKQTYDKQEKIKEAG